MDEQIGDFVVLCISVASSIGFMILTIIERTSWTGILFSLAMVLFLNHFFYKNWMRSKRLYLASKFIQETIGMVG